MNAKLDHPLTFHASLVTAFCFLLSAFPLRAQVWITNSMTISETNTAYDGRDLVISDSGVTVAMDGPHVFNSLLLTNAAVLTHSPCTATMTHKLDLTVTNAVVVSTNSRIDVSGRGYLAGRTTGNTTAGAATGVGGGSYGGRGGDASPLSRGHASEVYGDYADPGDWGSGAGSSAAGGGLVRLIAGALVLDGQLLANAAGGGSGGAGGGIHVAVETFSGAGSIRAAGSSAVSCCDLGGGGGGRIAVYAEDYSGFNLSQITAPGGNGAGGGTGGAGSVWLVLAAPHTHVQYTLPGLLRVYPTNGLGFPTQAVTNGLAIQFNKPISTNSFTPDKLLIQGPLGRVVPTGISQIGDRLYRFAFPPQTENGYYGYTLLPTLLDDEGFQLDQNANGIPGETNDAYNFTLILDTVPPRITASSPDGDAAGTATSVDVWFSEAMDPATMIPGNVTLRSPSTNTIPVSAVQQVGLNRWRVSFSAQTAIGTYVFDFSTNMTDLAGNRLDVQNSVACRFNLVPVDLRLSDVVVSTNRLWAGDYFTVSYTGRNATGAALLGDWTDALYLSVNDRWDIADFLLATAAHTGGLAQDAVYTNSLTVSAPGTLPGDYYLLVRADCKHEELEAGAETNNAVAFGPLPVSVHGLVADGGPMSGIFTPGQRAYYYVITLAPTQSLRLTLSGQAGANNELYVSQAAIPDRQAADQMSIAAGANQQVLLSGTPAGGTYYVLVYNGQPGGGSPFQITAEAGSFFVTKLTPNRASNLPSSGGSTANGWQPSGRFVPSTVTLAGAGFSRDTVVQFIATNGAVRVPTNITLVSASEITADLDLPNWPAGSYAVEVSRGARMFTLTNAFTVVQAGRGQLQANLIPPASVGFFHYVTHTVWLHYKNVGDAPMPAPLFQASVSTGVLTADLAQALSLNRGAGGRGHPTSSLQLMGHGSGATPGILQPGDDMQVALCYIPPDRMEGGTRVDFTLSYVTGDDVTWQHCDGGCSRFLRDGQWYEECWSSCMGEDWHVAWSGPSESMLRPPSIPADAWHAIWSNLPLQVGYEWGDYVIALGNQMNYLHTIGQDTTDVGRLWTFAVGQAADALHPVRTLAGAVDASAPAPGMPLVFRRMFANGIIPRYHTGALGRGWFHNWDFQVQQLPNGDVVVHGPAGSDRHFTLSSNGALVPDLGDFAALTLANGSFRLTEADGTLWQFRTDSLLDYVQDNNGNRVICGYASGLLSSLTHSSGKQFLLDYDGSGHLWHLTDPLGPGSADDRLTTYEYDGEHLVTVTAPGSRITHYAYQTTNAPALQHALQSVTRPDNTQDYFSYDEKGRLTQSAKTCCTGGTPVTYSYDTAGSITVTDGTGRQTVIRYGLDGLLGQAWDGEGRVINLGYGINTLLGRLIGPGGEQYRYSYDSLGNVTTVQDPVGHADTFAYEPSFSRLAQATDARQNGLNYAYDSKGNLASITYADYSRESFGHDASGNTLTWTNRRGNAISYAYNSAGQLTNKHYPTTQGRADFNYTYDAAGNLRTAVGPEGTNSLSYYTNTDWLQRIDYPGGKYFTFEYNGAGRRTGRTDQDGNVLGYAYDPQGRLSVMTNGTGQLIVNYEYDAAGRLRRKTLGNGVFTTYAYNAAGQVTNLVNSKADSTVLSAFAYEYDASARRTVMRVNQPRPGQPGGSWTETYGYDPLAQLKSVAYSASPTGGPGSTVTYAYDAAGNRTQVQSDAGGGFTDAYAANALNQYTIAGSATFGYDPDGNLTNELSTLNPQLSTNYGYDAENRLVSVTTPTDSWTYTYDSFGNRIATTHNGTTTRYVIDPIGLGNVAAEYDAGGSLVARYDHGFGLLERVNAASLPAFYTFNAVGHTAELSDSAGTPLNTYAFDAWGSSVRKSEVLPNPFGFVGELGVVEDADNLRFMRSRFYSVSLGRFVQSDPLAVRGGLSVYGYAANTPTSRVDPLGLSDDDFAVVIRNAPARGPSLGAADRGELLASLIENGVPAVALGVEVFLHAPVALLEWIFPLEHPNLRDEYPPAAYLRDDFANVPGWRTLHQLDLEESWTRDRMQGDLGMLPSLSTNNTQKSYSYSIRPVDPNDIIGPQGVGTAMFVRADSALPYQVLFENKADATAPAKLIVVTDTLDPNLDLSTLVLGEITFANQTIAIPTGLNHYKSVLPFTVGTNQIQAEVEATLDFSSRTLTVTLRAIDPSTGWYPEDPTVGILYPEDGTGRGQGGFSYIVSPRAGVPTGTVIYNRASIVFDFNDAIQTPQVFNTIDAGAPQSSVAALPAESGRTFLVQWNGLDDAGGSGLASYDIYMSTNGATFLRWLTATTNQSAWFVGAPGQSYFFYAIARDGVGNQPALLPPLQAMTTVPTNAPVLISGTNLVIRPGDGVSVTNLVVQGTPVGAWLFSLDPGAPAGAFINPTNGVLGWTPNCGQASTTNLISVRVTDSGWTNMTDAVSFTVAVGDCVQPGLGQQILLAGTSGRVPIYLISSVPLTNLQMTLVSPPGRLLSFNVQPIVPQICASSITPLTNSFQQLNLMACANQWLIGTQQVAWLNFTAATNQSSAFVSLQFTDLRGYQPDGTPVANFAPQAGRVVVVGEQPLLECVRGTNAQPQLILYGKPGMTCAVDWRTNLVAGSWVRILTGLTVTTNLWLAISPPPSTSALNFYRASGQLPPPLLEMHREGANYVIEWPAAYPACGLEEAATLSPSSTWLPSPVTIQQSGNMLRAVVPIGTTSKFYRLKCSQ